MWDVFREHWIRHAVDIVMVWVLFYFILSRLRKTRAMQMVNGLAVLLMIWGVSSVLKLNTLEHILTAIWSMSLLALVVIFQPELRKTLVEMADQPFLTIGRRETIIIDELIRAAFQMANRRTGALLVIEQEVGLKNIVDNGISLNSKLSSELLCTIFTPHSPLHDGAVIIHNGRILAASCTLPINENLKMNIRFGTRHQAGVSISEETDAIAIIVSEENGSVSLAYSGKMMADLEPDQIRDLLVLYIKQKERIGLKQWFTQKPRGKAFLEG